MPRHTGPSAGNPRGSALCASLSAVPGGQVVTLVLTYGAPTAPGHPASRTGTDPRHLAPLPPHAGGQTNQNNTNLTIWN